MPLRQNAGRSAIIAVSTAIGWVALGIMAQESSSLVTAQTAPLLQQSDLVYEGGFRVPGGTHGASSFDYGGWSLTFNPAKGSLFISGHPYQEIVAEISIPTPVNSSNPGALPVASVLQPFRDASEGRQHAGIWRTIGGYLIDGPKLIGSAHVAYDGGGQEQLSHWTAPANLSQTGQSTGLHRVGGMGAGVVGGPMAWIPSEWRTALGGRALTGLCCVSIISRSSLGPAAFAFEPNDLNVRNPVPVQPLVHYTMDNPLAPYDQQNDYWNGSTTIRGVAMIGRSLLFFGKHGIGKYCYGSGDQCSDPDYSYQADHAYPYVNQVWAYDAQDLAAVKSGSRAPWSVKPYALWRLTFPTPSRTPIMGGAAYDFASQRLWLVQIYGEGDNPVIHQYRIGSGGSTVPPPPHPPLNLRIITSP